MIVVSVTQMEAESVIVTHMQAPSPRQGVDVLSEAEFGVMISHENTADSPPCRRRPRNGADNRTTEQPLS